MADGSASLPVSIAPAPRSGQSPNEQIDGSPRMAFTCTTCARRKVKCDKITPACTSCQKGRLECHYQAPAPRKRKRKPDEDVQGKLEHYERLLKENGILTPEPAPGEGASERHFSPPYPFHRGRDISSHDERQRKASVDIHDSEVKRSGKLLAGNGKTRYINSSLWRSLDAEALRDASSDEEADLNQEYYNHVDDNVNPLSGALLGPGTPTMEDLVGLHPSAEEAWKLWNIYLSHVEPVVKMVHVPSAVRMIESAARDPSSLPKASQCLLFAIYHFAAVAMLEEEHQQLGFSLPRSEMQTKYHWAVRQSLVNLAFLKTAEMPVMQAYTSLLLSVRSTYDPVIFWVLTGVAIRIAQRMGMHRDGEELGLKPFDVQMRRRVWWQLLPLDGLASQLSGTGIAIGPDAWDTKQPWNVNDADIWPGMTETPIEHKGATDMTFCLARSEINKFHQRVKNSAGSLSNIWQIRDTSHVEKLIDEVEETVEGKYIRYCDPIDPVHNLTLGMVRGGINSSRLRVKLSQAKQKDDMTDQKMAELCLMAIRVIDYAIAAYSNPGLKRFLWHLRAFFPWDFLICVLTGLKKPGVLSPSEAHMAWERIEQCYRNNIDMSIGKRALHVAVGKLTLKTWDANPEGHRSYHQEPEFITTLRSTRSMKTPQSTASQDTPFSSNGHGVYGVMPIDPMLTATVPGPPQIGRMDIDFVGMEDFNIDQTDWRYWDQMIKEFQSNPIGS